ncbi:Cobalt-zinc-cadmium resistance protein CzcB [compost metagenome]
MAVQVPTENLAVALSVPDQAIQTLEEQPTVFVRTGEGFVAQAVELGSSANGYVEIRKGLQAGQQVAALGSFVLKSELGKASAEHAH